MSDQEQQAPAYPVTVPVYLRDAFARALDAVVIAVDREGGAVLLDRTIFYPGGGGQPNDTGILQRIPAGRKWRVAATKKAGPAILHLIEADGSLPEVGDLVHAVIDWEQRYRLMRTHTAMHVLCGVVFREFGALVTGGNMALERARMDFELEDLSPERVASIEELSNAEISAARDVTVRFLPRDEAFAIPDLIRTKINLLPPGITEIRIVEIAGLDLQADGGTHVANTREVGGIQIVGTRSKGRSNKRLEIELIDAAL